MSPSEATPAPTAPRAAIDLIATARGGIGWTLGATIGQVLVSIGVLAVLARLLSPRDFGIVGAAQSVNLLAQLFADLGTAPGLVQRPELRRQHQQSALLVSLLIGAVMTALVAATAPWAAAFFGLPELGAVLPALSATFLLAALAAVPTALLRRQLRFRALAGVQVAGQLLGYAPVAIGLALLGAGVWALVAALLLQTALSTALLLWLGPRLPRPRWCRQELRELLAFGSGYSLARVANHVATQGDAWIVGGWLGGPALGLWQRALQLLYAPVNLLGTAADKVAFPLLAGLQDDRERTRASFLHASRLLSAIGLPAAALLFVLAPELVALLLGDGWQDCVLPLRILALGLPFRLAYKIGHALARAHGAVHRTAWRQAVFAALVLGGALLLQGHGLAGVAAAVVAATLVNHALTLDLSLQLLQLPWRAAAKGQLRHLLAAAAVAGPAWAARELLPPATPPLLVLAAAALAAAAGAVLLLRCAPRLLQPELAVLLQLLRRRPLPQPGR